MTPPARRADPAELHVWLDLLRAVMAQAERAAEPWLDAELTDRVRHARRAVLDLSDRGDELARLHDDLVRELHGSVDEAEREAYG